MMTENQQKLVDEAIRVAQELKALVMKSEKIRKREDMENLADQIIFWLADFSRFEIELEQMYRIRIRELQEKNDMSFVAAENHAKTEEIYGIFKKVKLLYALGEEKIRILKLMIGNVY